MNFVFTTIYPGSKKYFNEFIESINEQSYKNFKIFIVLNGTSLNSTQKKKIINNYTIFNTNTYWQDARIKGLKKLLKLNPKNIIFIDSDDVMHVDRIKINLKEIRKYDFVVNNCYLFKKEKKINRIWLNRKRGDIKLSHIKYKNFIGCTNTIVRAKSLKKVINMINVNLLAFDWCMAKLLLIKKFKGLYTSKSLSYYRQYAQNTSSLIEITQKKVLKDIECKLEHFKYFEKFGINYKKQILELEGKYKKINNKRYYSMIKKNFKSNNQYWWSSI
jgi:hypothetical protein